MTGDLAIGLDIGGTKLGCAVGTTDGRVLASHAIATDTRGAPEPQLDRLLAWAREQIHVLDAGPARAMGVACPGPLSYAEGRLLEVPNMIGWQGFGVGAWLDTVADGLPSRFLNDANASLLAEVLWGVARGARSAAFLTFSTGMGAGLWLDGRLYEGPRALAGEIGHLRLSEEGPVGFGKRGSVEGWTSGPGIELLAAQCRRAAMQRGEPVGFSEGADTVAVFAAARSGDPTAFEVVQLVGDRLGQIIALLADLLDLQCVVLGTIGIAHWDLLSGPVWSRVRAEVLPSIGSSLEIAPSDLRSRGAMTSLAVARAALEPWIADSSVSRDCAPERGRRS